MILCLIVVLPFLASLCAAFLSSRSRTAASWLAGSVAMACAVLAASQYRAIADGQVLRFVAAWAPQYGLEFTLRMDGFAWLFALLVSGMGVLVVLYARYYMSAADPVPRFFAFLLAFMGSMLGVVLSGHLIQLVVFWELTSLSSFMLIAYWYHREDARRGARMSLIVTMAGGLALLLGVMVLGQIAGSYDLDAVLAAGDAIRSHPHYALALGLVLAGVFTKSAQFPFHFWLPQAMAAPTPVSAYLHSATMVKAGVFLLARLWPALSGTQLWFWLVCSAGAVTLLLGAASATFQRDMKGVLAYSTISHLGLVTMLLGMNSAMALVAAIFHMMNHATFKASLFMGAGVVDHETGTRDLARLGGLRHFLPVTALLAMVAAGAMAGVPLLNGFLSKEMFFSESLHAGGAGSAGLALPVVATIAGVFSVAYSVRFIHRVFFGPVSRDMPRTPIHPARAILAPSVVLVCACLLVGILPEQTVGGVLAIAAGSVLGGDLPEYELKVWHGFTLPLFMSLVALTGGIALYAFLHATGRSMKRTPLLSRIDAGRAFDLLNVAAIRGAARLTHHLFSWRLQAQLFLIAVSALTAGFLPLLFAGWIPGVESVTAPDPLFALLWLIGCAGALGAAVRTKYQRFAALIMVGVAGLTTVLTFAWFSAPDLALTQLVVETVTLVLILLGLRWLPRRLETVDPRRTTVQARLRRIRDFSIAVLGGVAMAAVAWAVLTGSPDSEVGAFYMRNSLELAGGRNVVNVILVDFRGFDTLGEITVVGIVAMIVYALLRRFRPAPESVELPSAQRRVPQEPVQASVDSLLPPGDLKVPAVLVRLLLPFAGLISVYFLLRGHQAPGGGFVGGLVMATALISQFMVGGTLWVESRLKLYPLTLIGTGLLCAVAAGLLAWASGLPFLTARVADVHLPLIGDLHLPSVLLFDLGVYLLVVGATVLILVSLAHQSMRSPRRSLNALEPEDGGSTDSLEGP